MGVTLRPAQEINLAREGTLRACLAQLAALAVSRPLVIHASWICANPLCGALNDGCRARCCVSKCERPSPPAY
eukprot:11165982-Karenia_brevis.AAC.1